MFPSNKDDAFLARKMKLNKRIERMSLFNQLIIYGRVIPGHVNLSSRNNLSPRTENEFTPPKVEFNITPENTNIILKRSFAMLENIEKQDLFAWKNEFVQTALLAGWDDRIAAQVLKSSISTNYFGYISGCNTTSEIIQTLFKMKHPSKNHVKYLNQLSNIKQNHYLRISEYKQEIENVIRKLSVCLN
ncbi:hypothetical protein DMUE_0724 [Dictyocoela muelleri]|nr:hypothetical protein DMUE_0724 [Dictyocoela muelleri]